jgi:hypothetical protein
MLPPDVVQNTLLLTLTSPKHFTLKPSHPIYHVKAFADGLHVVLLFTMRLILQPTTAAAAAAAQKNGQLAATPALIHFSAC